MPPKAPESPRLTRRAYILSRPLSKRSERLIKNATVVLGCACQSDGRRFHGVIFSCNPQLPSDARHLVGQGDGGRLWRLAFEELDQPRQRPSTASNMLDHSSGPDHQHAAQSFVAGARDNAEPDLARGRMILRGKADPGCELAPRSE